MDFFNKAKQAAEKYIIEDSSSSNNYKKKSDTGSLLTKAKDAAEKYHAKEKAAEYAQKRVAKRNGDNRDKSAVSKAMEATEDFFAKQGQPKCDHPGGKKVKQADNVLGKAMEAATKYSKKH